MELTAAALSLNSIFAGYDQAILSLMHRLAVSMGGLLTPLCKLITLLGEKGLIFFVAAVALMLFPRTRKAGVCMFGAVCPFMTEPLYREFWTYIGSPSEDGYSFPSGHVTAAAAGMVSLCLSRGRKWVLPSVVWVLLMAISRNYLMAHYPSDVLAAAIIGTASAFIAWGITQLIFRLLEDHDGVPFCAFVLDFDPRQLKHMMYKGKH